MPVSPVLNNRPVVQTDTSEIKRSAKKNDNLSIQDFFALLAAQLQNQDMMNPVSDTEFMGQMAQFSALNAMQELNSKFSNFMAVSYIGKQVTASFTDDNGKKQDIQGVATKVEFKDGETFIHVDGQKISASNITEVTN